MRVEKIGDATLYLGDCREILGALPVVDLLCTDPPYGILDCGGKWGRKSELQWDKEPATNLGQMLAAGKEQAIWGGNYFAVPPSRGWLVWYKHDSNLSAADVELCWTSRDMNARMIDQTIAATNAERVGHPTQKPLRVMRWTLSFFPAACSVLDPYMGSGTTGVAAVEAGKEFVGVELDPKYFDIACRRIEQAYNQRPLFVAEPAPKPVQLGLEEA
jgi:site-specific DNA-methyltransferase (adenine-specific)